MTSQWRYTYVARCPNCGDETPWVTEISTEKLAPSGKQIVDREMEAEKRLCPKCEEKDIRSNLKLIEMSNVEMFLE